VRRFPTTLHLEDYTPEQLASIARLTALSRYGLHFGAGLEARLTMHIAQRHVAEIPKHNASLAVALVEAATSRLAARLAADSANTPLACAASTVSTAADSWSSDLHTLEASDFGIDAVEGGVGAREKVLAEIRGLPSHLDSARAALLAADATLAFAAMYESAAELALRGATRLAIAGGPGTEGVRVAQMLLQLLQAHGVLQQGASPTTRSVLSLVGESLAVIVAKLHDMAEAATGSMLLLTDVGALATDGAGAGSGSTGGTTAARALAAVLSPLPARACVVLLGDTLELPALLRNTAGLGACFPPPLLLPALDATQVAAAVVRRADALRLVVPPQLESRLVAHVSGGGGGGNGALAADLTAQSGQLVDMLLLQAVGALARRTSAAAEDAKLADGRELGVGGSATTHELAPEDFGLE